MYLLQVCTWAILAVSVLGFHHKRPKQDIRPYTGPEGVVGSPLLLTPHIKSGNIHQARDLALVTGLTPNITSYSGFITVNQTCGSNLFFWFFPSQNDWLKDPVSLWLNGGPGSSSLYGLLTENGPYALTLEGELKEREYSWNRNSSVIYIDNPVGTGFSYTGREECYATDEVRVGQELMEGLEQFFQLFPEIQNNPFFLTGESYAGKYIPAVAYQILTSNSSVNLQGLAIGNGFTDPINQADYASYLYQLGLIDSTLRDKMYDTQKNIIDLINNGQFVAANLVNGRMLDEVSYASGILAFYNYLFEYGEDEPDIGSFLDDIETRNALHVGDATWGEGSSMVYLKLEEDLMKSVKPWVEVLLENYRVLLYNGQLDIICAYPLMMDYVRTLQWSRADEYETAARVIWTVGDRVAGYAKTAGNFTEVLVRNAGHMVPTDQPEWALDLYHKFIFNQPFTQFQP